MSETTFHHEQATGVLKELAKNVKQLTSVIHEMSTPFAEENNDLFALDTLKVMSDELSNL